jgi:hypothetical protein
VRDLAGGDFLDQQRNAVLIGGTGTGKTPYGQNINPTLRHAAHVPSMGFGLVVIKLPSIVLRVRGTFEDRATDRYFDHGS